jgi:hypothetical protein
MSLILWKKKGIKSEKSISHQESKTKEKHNVGAGQTTGVMTTTSELCLIPGVMARGVGLLQVLKDDVHRLQDVAGHVWVLGDVRDRGHAKVHQNLGHIPHQGHQPPDLDDVVRHGILKKPSELNELHQLITVVSGVESLGLRLCQRYLVQF